MATNVSQQDETLHKVIEWCDQREVEGLRLANALLQKHDLAAYAVVKAQIDAYHKTAEHCRSMLGYSGSMPSCLNYEDIDDSSPDLQPQVGVLRGRELPRDHKGTGRGTASQLPAATQYQSSAPTIEKRRQARTAFRRVRQVPILQVPRRKRNAVRDDRSERKEDELSIMLDEANAYERGMDDDLTFQTVREIAGTAYMAGRSAPPTAVEIEAVAKRLCWNSCKPVKEKRS